MQPYEDLFNLFGAHRFWLTDILACIVVAYTTCVFGVAFGKMGRSPYLGLLFAIPLVGVVLLWAFGLRRWPQAETGERDKAGLT
jgi:hypothetical protein